MMRIARLSCASCKAALPKPGARCRACGFAFDYNPALTRREHQMALAVGLALIAVAIAIAACFMAAMAE